MKTENVKKHAETIASQAITADICSNVSGGTRMNVTVQV